MEGNLVTSDIGDFWIVIINSVSKNNHLMGMLIRDQLLLWYPKGKSCYKKDAVVDHVFGKKIVNLPNKRKRWKEALTLWKKRSIFFTLPY